MVITIRENLFKEFALCSSILIMKILAMAILTGRQRFRKKAFANPEDVKGKLQKVVLDDPDVERVRRAHQNDLENILPWFVMTLIWLTTNPSYYLAMMLMRIFVVTRITHTLVYAVFPMQPYRALAFFAGYLITIYEAVSTTIYYM